MPRKKNGLLAGSNGVTENFGLDDGEQLGDTDQILGRAALEEAAAAELAAAQGDGEEEPEIVIPMTAKSGPGRKPGGKPGAALPTVDTIIIPDLDLREVQLPVHGSSPLIVHRFSEKAKREMAAKQQQIAQHKKAAKEPVQDFLQSLYLMPGAEVESYTKGKLTYAKSTDGFAFPAGAFKLAAVSACRHVQGISMAYAKGSFHILGTFVEIEGDDPWMREDIVRLPGIRPVADLRYRGEFKEWMVKLNIRYNARAINPSQIANLLNVAGFAVGIGEWRPEKDGSNGMFSVKKTDIKQPRK